jgi:ATP-binding protein involved in chromosome partitioning
MKIAIPISGGKLCPHFGHCEEFALIDVNPDTKEFEGTQMLRAPDHEPGLLPRWLHERGATVVIAGGIGRRAQDLFAENGIRVIIGASSEDPETVVQAFMDNSLETGDNICDH